MEYIKLSDLSKNKTKFLVEEVSRPVWKMWDAGSKKMVTSDKPMSGMRKTYTITSDHGKFDIGEQNLGTLFCLAMDNGQSDIIGKEFIISDNGKTGVDIRYYFNHYRNDFSESDQTIDNMPQF